jgi:hypothetical protein
MRRVVLAAANSSTNSVGWPTIVLPAAIGVGGVLIATWLSLHFQGTRDDKTWARTVRARSYEDALVALNKLVNQTLHVSEWILLGAKSPQGWKKERGTLLGLADAVDAAALMLQAFGSPEMCEEMRSVMENIVRPLVRRLAADSPPDHATVLHLYSGADASLKRLTYLVRQDLEVKVRRRRAWRVGDVQRSWTHLPIHRRAARPDPSTSGPATKPG